MIESFDFLSLSPTLYVNSKTRFKNITGGFITIFTFIIITILSCIITYEWITRNNLRWASNEIESTQSSFNITKYPIILQVVDNTGKGFDDLDKIFSFDDMLPSYTIHCHIE